MNPLVIVAVALVLLFAGSALTEKKKETKPNTNKPPDDPAPETDKKQKTPSEVTADIVKSGAGILGTAGVIKGATGSIGSLVAQIAAAFPPGLLPLILATAAYIFLKELTELGARSKDFSRRIGRAARPSFGMMHALEVAFIRDVLTKAGFKYTETVTRDERLDTDYGQIRTIGEFTSFSRPAEFDVTQWRNFNRLARKLALNALMYQSHVASNWSSNWTGLSGLGGRKVPTLIEVGFSGPGAASWYDVDLSGTVPIPYDSIQTPGGFYFSLANGLDSLEQPGDDDLTKQAQLHGVVSAALQLRADPTWFLVYDRNAYAKRVFDWGNFSALGVSRSSSDVLFAAERWAAKFDFRMSLDLKIAGTLDGDYEPALSSEGLLSEKDAPNQATEEIAVLMGKPIANKSATASNLSSTGYKSTVGGLR